MSRQRKRLALIHLAPSEMSDFVATDLRLLSEVYEVKRVFYRGRLHGWPDGLRILWAIAATDVNVSWFAYRQAYFAVLFSRILRKPSVVVVGGFDVAPEERPDKRIPPREVKQLRFILRHASAVLPDSERLAELARALCHRDDMRVIPLGFDTERFSPNGVKDGSVVTTAYIRRDNIERKGLLTFVRAATELPETKFILVGKAVDDSIEILRREAGPNTEFTGWLEDDELIQVLRRASVYVQASTHEGFGSGLAQAMLCGCVPVVTNKGAIPEVVGDEGVYVEVGDPQSLARGIREALKNMTLGERARLRVVQQFSLEKRRRALLGVVGEVLPGQDLLDPG